MDKVSDTIKCISGNFECHYSGESLDEAALRHGYFKIENLRQCKVYNAKKIPPFQISSANALSEIEAQVFYSPAENERAAREKLNYVIIKDAKLTGVTKRNNLTYGTLSGTLSAFIGELPKPVQEEKIISDAKTETGTPFTAQPPVGNVSNAGGVTPPIPGGGCLPKIPGLLWLPLLLLLLGLLSLMGCPDFRCNLPDLDLDKVLPDTTEVNPTDTLRSDSKEIVLSMYDWSVEDGDVVRITFNGQTIADSVLITRKPVSFKIQNTKNGVNILEVYGIDQGTVGPASPYVEILAGSHAFTYQIKVNRDDTFRQVIEITEKR